MDGSARVNARSGARPAREAKISWRRVQFVLYSPPCYTQARRRSFAPSMRLLWTLFIVMVAIAGAQALSEGEQSALKSFSNDWPGLQQQEPPWTSNFSAACDQPAWFGLGCSDVDGEVHVTELYVEIGSYFVAQIASSHCGSACFRTCPNTLSSLANACDTGHSIRRRSLDPFLTR